MDVKEYYIKYQNLYRDYLDLLKAVSEVPDEKERIHILLVFAGNALHDVPEDIVQIFFDGYFDLKAQVNAFCEETANNELI